MKRPSGTEILAILGIVALLISVLLPWLEGMRETSGRLPCPSHLRQIGQAILLYSNDHGGWYPDRLETLAVTEDLPTEVFVCPSSGHKRAERGPTTQATLASFASGKHISYEYVRPPLPMRDVGPNDVIAYEPPTNHPDEGSNVLYGDGHVNFITHEALQRELEATRAKWRSVTTRPATTSTSTTTGRS